MDSNLKLVPGRYFVANHRGLCTSIYPTNNLTEILRESDVVGRAAAKVNLSLAQEVAEVLFRNAWAYSIRRYFDDTEGESAATHGIVEETRDRVDSIHELLLKQRVVRVFIDA